MTKPTSANDVVQMKQQEDTEKTSCSASGKGTDEEKGKGKDDGKAATSNPESTSEEASNVTATANDTNVETQGGATTANVGGNANPNNWVVGNLNLPPPGGGTLPSSQSPAAAGAAPPAVNNKRDQQEANQPSSSTGTTTNMSAPPPTLAATLTKEHLPFALALTAAIKTVPKPKGISRRTLSKDITEADVLLGRGGLTNVHSGNVAFRELVAQRKAEYLGAPKSIKSNIARSIVDVIKSRGGKFLERDDVYNTWRPADDERARIKTSQALREKVPEVPGACMATNNEGNDRMNMPSPGKNKNNKTMTSSSIIKQANALVVAVTAATSGVGVATKTPSGAAGLGRSSHGNKEGQAGIAVAPATTTTTNTGKRKRGRPRKHPVTPATSNAINATNSAGPPPVANAITSPQSKIVSPSNSSNKENSEKLNSLLQNVSTAVTTTTTPDKPPKKQKKQHGSNEAKNNPARPSTEKKTLDPSSLSKNKIKQPSSSITNSKAKTTTTTTTTTTICPQFKKTIDSSSMIKQVHDHDVLLGRGAGVNFHPGNIRFRHLVKSIQPKYAGTPKMDKANIASAIVNEIRSLNPPGRFLRRVASFGEFEDCWLDVGDKRAREKTSQALREKFTVGS